MQIYLIDCLFNLFGYCVYTILYVQTIKNQPNLTIHLKNINHWAEIQNYDNYIIFNYKWLIR